MKLKWRAFLMQAAICGGLLTSGIQVQAAENAFKVSCAPAGMVETGDGSFLVTDIYNKVIWKIQDGNGEIYAGSSGVKGLYDEPAGGYRDGTLSQSMFGRPWAIVPFKGGYAVSDPVNNAVRLLSNNQVKTISLNISLSNQTGLAVDEEGSLYIADTSNNAIRKVSADGSVSTWLSGLSEPTGLCFKNGSLYIADSGNNRIIKAESGNISAVTGGSSVGYMDGEASQALFANPMGVAVDDDGTVYVSDTGNGAIRKIQGNAVSTVTGSWGDESVNFPVSPAGLLIVGDSIYVCDTFSKMAVAIKK